MKNTTKLLWSVLALACCSIMPISVYAEQTDQTVTSEGTYTASVEMYNASTFSVQIPKTISIKDNSGSYQIAVSGDISSMQQIEIVPDASFIMKQSGKSDKTATITQEKQVFSSTEAAAGTTTTGSISVPDATAGTWKGSFNFEVSLGDVVLQPFTVTQSNRAKVGYTGAEGENLVIPATFQDKDGTWYKVTSIGDSAFGYCTNLTSVTIPSGVTISGNYAFSSCDNLTSVTISSGVTISGNYAFNTCPNLTSVTISSGVTISGSYAFNTCPNLTSVTISSGVTISGSSAFGYCTNLTSVTIPSGGTSIPDYMFSSCTSLTSVTIPNSVTSIKSMAFDNCTSLTNVNLPEGLTTIGSRAFSNSGLTSIEIPASVTKIDNGYRAGAFQDCTSLTSVTFAEGSQLQIIGSYAFDTCTSLTSIEIPSTVIEIGDHAFYKCPITSIKIPSSVTTIGEYAFCNCTSLTSVTFAEGSQLTTIGKYTFSSCKNLTSITLPSTVTSIGSGAFNSCSSLSSIEIPDSVTSIGSGAFYNCSNLTSITFRGTMEQWNAITKGGYWNSSTGNYTIYCTDGTIAKS